MIGLNTVVVAADCESLNFLQNCSGQEGTSSGLNDDFRMTVSGVGCSEIGAETKPAMKKQLKRFTTLFHFSIKSCRKLIFNATIL